MTHHDATNAIVAALKQFDVRREVLCDEIVVRELDHRHLFVRIDLARADAGKMFETAETASALQAAQVDGRVAEYFAGRTAERARVKTVRQIGRATCRERV